MSMLVNPFVFGGAGTPDFDDANLFSRIRAEGLTNSGAPYSNDDPIPQCDDLSGNANHWGQAIESRRPIYKTNQLNGKAAIRFNSVNLTSLGGPFFNSLSECEFFIVVKVDADPAASSASSGAWRLNAADDATSASHYPFTDNNVYEGAFIDIPTSSRISVNPTPSLALWRLYNIQAKAGTNNYIIRLDGTAIVTTTKTLEFSATQNGAIGESRSVGPVTVYMNGLVAEFFFLSAAAGTTQRESIRDYINSYYGLSTV